MYILHIFKNKGGANLLINYGRVMKKHHIRNYLDLLWHLVNTLVSVTTFSSVVVSSKRNIFISPIYLYDHGSLCIQCRVHVLKKRIGGSVTFEHKMVARAYMH